MTVMVPIIVEKMVARMATRKVVQMALIVMEEENIFSYHRREKPEKVVSERVELKENTTV